MKLVACAIRAIRAKRICSNLSASKFTAIKLTAFKPTAHARNGH
jgi:hypothetical protein